MRLRSRLLLLVAIPVVFLLFFAARTALEKAQQAQEMSALVELTDLSATVGALVHEMQKERGMSAGFIGSHGANFAAELPKQRAEVDKRKAELDAHLARFLAGSGSRLNEKIGAAVQPLGELAARRQAIAALAVPAPEAIGYFTRSIASLLGIVGQAASLSTDTDVTRLAAAYSGLLQAKEYAGVERATLSNVLSADRFTPEMLARFFTVTATQDAWFAVFRSYASTEQAAFFAAKLTGPAVDEVARIKKTAIERMHEASLGLDAKLWFARATDRINLLKEVEDKLAADLTGGAAAHLAQARRIMALYGGLTLAAVVLTLFVAMRLIRGILDQLGGEPGDAVAIAQAITEGKLDNRIDVREGDTHSLFYDMKRMQEELLSRIGAERATAAENQRIRIALDCISIPVTLSDGGGALIYMNPAAVALFGEMEEEIRTRRPEFAVARMLGGRVGDLFEDEGLKAAYRERFESTRSFNTPLAGKTLHLIASPVYDAQGEYLGRVTQWVDRSAEVKIEREVEEVVQVASYGILDTRLDTAGKTGFHAALAEGINELLDNTQNALQATSAVLTRVAGGDLSRSIDGDYAGIFGQLKDDTNATIERLRDVVGRIQEATQTINTAAKEIAAGNNDLSQRTEQQASSLEETASTMEQLSKTVRQNAENAGRASELGNASSTVAARGGAMMGRIVATMNDIQQSSRKIADIIGVIDSIAFQTNILALNAAVEAARAGETGRGFAVVATEVRNLAQRSAGAAKEIKALINETTGRVEGGARQVQEAGRTMEEIVASFREVAELVNSISGASREQSTGIAEATAAVGQMDKATQQNAALVEQAAAAAENLEAEAGTLARIVGTFHLAGGVGLPGPALRDATPRQLPPPA